MGKDEIVKAAQEMVRAGMPFVLTTVDEKGQPQSRWMGGSVLDEPLTLWMATAACSRKVDQLRANPAAQLMYSDQQFGRVITISGACEIVTGIEPKQRLWKAMPGMSRYVSGPDDPTFGVIKLVGKRVELLAMSESFAPQVAEL
jgi:general stress protein 26